MLFNIPKCFLGLKAHHKMKKPKILHIGGSHSVHVTDWIQLLHKEGYEQCVLSYKQDRRRVNRSIPVYFHPYDCFFPIRTGHLRSSLDPKAQELLLYSLIDDIIKKEKPDIIHAHFLMVACVPAFYAADRYNLPLFSSIWSRRVLASDPTLRRNIGNALKKTHNVIVNCPHLCDDLSKFYSYDRNKCLEINPPLNLSLFHPEQVKDLSRPRILSARTMRAQYHQDLLLYALPKLVQKFSNLRATLIIGQSAEHGKKYFNKMISLAKALNVSRYCTFIGRSLSQVEFSNLIKRHNIVYSVAEDPGCSQTTVQAAYSGAITIVQEYPAEPELLVPNENILYTKLTRRSVLRTLYCAIRDMRTLQPKFYKNNRKFFCRSEEYVLPILISAYNSAVDLE